MSVSRVNGIEVLGVWLTLLPQIRRGLGKGAGDTLSERCLWEGVLSGTFELWVLHDGDEVLGGMFLKIEKRERGTALLIIDVVAGTGRDLKAYAEVMLPRIREYGDMLGAYTIESVSRPGAARMLMRLGCKPKAVIMELRHGQRIS